MDLKSIIDLALNGASLVTALVEKGSNMAGPASSTFTKGLEVVKTGIEAGREVTPVIAALAETFTAGKKDVTQEELDEIEAKLDEELDDYLKPMEPRS